MSRIRLLLCAIVIVALVIIAYRPGLSSGFVFDDAANLPSLGAQGPVDNAASFFRYITSGKADPTGRPIALLTFLIDAHDWPAPATPFKRTNLALHAINALLLLACLRALGEALSIEPQRRDFAALLGAATWALHPFLASTVLYVVQREAMLPATFTLFALVIWLHGRRRALAGSLRPSHWWLGAILGLTLLATLSKANGALIPLLILACASVLPTAPAEAAYRRMTLRYLVPCAAIVVAWLTWLAVSTIGEPALAARGWSIGQRLLTEPAVIMDYLSRLWLLRPVQGSVFHDQYPAATGWLSPWYTLPSILLCVAAPILAWLYRRMAPAVAVAVLFYAGGQLMESTSVPLELYFEHRNYLPTMMMFWPVALAIGRLGRGARLSIAAILMASLTGLTFAQASLWTQPLTQAQYWASLSPGSPRAQAYAAQEEAAAGHLATGVSRIRAESKQFADEPQVAFTLIDLACKAHVLSEDDLTFAAQSLRHTRRDPGVLMTQWFGDLIGPPLDMSCVKLDAHAISVLLDAADANPSVQALPGRRQDVMHLRGLLALAQGDASTATRWFDSALRESPGVEVALSQAAALGQAGYPGLALEHLDRLTTLPAAEERSPAQGMRWLHDRVLERQDYWAKEIAHLRLALETDKNRNPRK